MLTRNLWVKKGLCNGAMGIVKTIIYKEGQYPPVSLVAVLIEFENFSRPPIMDVFQLLQLFRELLHQKIWKGINYPLCWGITIHKSQGLALPNAVIDIGTQESIAGLAYVAIARVGKLSDLIIEPTTLDRLNAVKKAKNFQYRLDDKKRFDEICKSTITRFRDLHAVLEV